MDYPNGYNVPAFPAGKQIAVSRFMGIGILVLFLILVCLGGLILWSVRSSKVDPFLISTNPITGEWTIVAHSHGDLEQSSDYAMQTAVIGNFIEKWFLLSADMDANSALWKQCDRIAYCATEEYVAYADSDCYIFCATGDGLYNYFAESIMPDYQERYKQGETLAVQMDGVRITPYGSITENGGSWMVQATVQSNLRGEMDIIAFVKIARNKNYYPKTFGFYVADFNSYKVQ